MEKLLKHHEKPSIDGPGQVAPAGFVDVFFFAENPIHLRSKFPLVINVPGPAHGCQGP